MTSHTDGCQVWCPDFCRCNCLWIWFGQGCPSSSLAACTIPEASWRCPSSDYSFAGLRKSSAVWLVKMAKWDLQVHTRSPLLSLWVNIASLLSIPGNVCCRNPILGAYLEFFVWPSREFLLRSLFDNYKYKTWYEYEGKTFCQSSTAGSPMREVKWSRKLPPKGHFFKVPKLPEKWTQIMSNCLGKCETGKK